MEWGGSYVTQHIARNEQLQVDSEAGERELDAVHG